jgi:hypothetical protein
MMAVRGALRVPEARAKRFADEEKTMSPTQPLPPKKEVGLALLERSSVFVHLDPRQDNVVVPALFKNKPQLVLQVGMDMPVPIPDLRFDDEGMSCTLSFNRVPSFCVVPWSSVFALVGEDGRGMVWPDDVPAEVARQAQAREGRGSDSAPRKDGPKVQTREPREGTRPEATTKPKRTRKRPALAAVPDGEEVAAPAAAKAASGRTSPAPIRPVAAPSPATRNIVGPRKKRELPPYLRVVK